MQDGGTVDPSKVRDHLSHHCDDQQEGKLKETVFIFLIQADRDTINQILEYVQQMTEELLSQSRARRQFITYAKARAIDDVARLATMFVQYLNSNVGGGGGGEDEG